MNLGYRVTERAKSRIRFRVFKHVWHLEPGFVPGDVITQLLALKRLMMVTEQFESQFLPQIRAKRERTITSLESNGYVLSTAKSERAPRRVRERRSDGGDGGISNAWSPGHCVEGCLPTCGQVGGFLFQHVAEKVGDVLG